MNRVLTAEWIKLRSLRSTWSMLAGLFAVGLGISLLSLNRVHDAYAEAGADWDPTRHSMTVYVVAQLILGVLGALVVTSEFATGLMRTTLTATPARHRVLAAKAVLAAAVSLVAGQALMLCVFLVGQWGFARNGVPRASLGDPGVPAAVAAGGLYLAVIGLLGVALGTIMRATAGAIVTLVGIVFIIPGIAGVFPSWIRQVFVFWPTLGGAAALGTVPDPDFPHPWWGLGGMALGGAAVLAAAFVVLRRRDV
ncbi:ABC transporter permease [Actinoplanes couchii]|uniref:ABC transporter permease n=1 Tax=Actinoplanes couchii TaxID=403638 RepID=A0ABQ3XRY5_9ACTN|nr:ABC transporter permease [Actinoplanes couchii]MDR6318758.1 ABC-type transport system involved in multi-copper enzyme maturation permease subunit [Actinoplanes couchii]GID61286.1 ABC transporter permease [Actinoplanes couchii]